MTRFLKRAHGHKHCMEMDRAFLPVTVIMKSGTEFVVRDAPVWKAVMASCSAPGLVPLTEINDMLLGDGGLVNNVPASALKNYGCGFVISSNVSQDPAKSNMNLRSLGGVMTQSLEIMIDQTLKKYLDYTDFEIKPPIHGYSAMDWRIGDQIIPIGEKAIKPRLAELKRLAERRGLIMNNQ